MSCGDRLAEELRSKGYRVTAQRAILLETIAHSDGHSNVQQVYQEARKRLPGLNLATVYRTVESLGEAGLIDWYTNGAEPMQFALRDHDNPHGHLVCQNCGEVFELDLALVDGFKQRVSEDSGFQIEESHLTLQGICMACSSSDLKGR